MKVPKALPKALKRLGTALVLESEKEILNFVRGYIMHKMDKLTVPLLIESITNDTPLLVSPKDTAKLQRTMSHMLRNKTARKLWTENANKIDAEVVLKWWALDRPDLFAVVLNWPDRAYAARYMERQIAQVKMDVIGITPPEELKGDLVLRPSLPTMQPVATIPNQLQPVASKPKDQQPEPFMF